MSRVRYIVHVYRRTSRSWTLHALAFRSREAARHAAGWLVGPGDGAVAIESDSNAGAEVFAMFGELPPEYDVFEGRGHPPFPVPSTPYGPPGETSERISVAPSFSPIDSNSSDLLGGDAKASG